MTFIRVALDVPLPTLFDYLAADAGPADIGRRVRVPFGRKQLVGVIMALAQTASIDPGRVKRAGDILRELPALPGDVVDMLWFCARYYHHPIGEVVAAALPAHVRAPNAGRRREPQALAATASGREALATGLKRSPALARLLEHLDRNGPLDAAGVARLSPTQKRGLRQLITRGWVAETAEPGSPQRPDGDSEDPPRPELNTEQAAAVAAIAAGGTSYHTWLLHGVTGSGKTEVYLRAMEAALSRDRQVLFLVPEIGLTPQLEARIRARFARWRIVTLHSGLGDAARAAHWSAAHAGHADIVVGTRSAIFVPLPRLGLVVVDEEHDGSYKQIEGMRYSARDLAVWRGRQRNVPVILGSATPSLETYHAALNGRYGRLVLARRANDAPLPDVRIVPMAGKPGAAHGLSAQALEAIRARLEARQQVLVFINRRGYAPVLVCSACAWAPACHRCSARLVLHKSRGRLLCHHCGHSAPVPAVCPSCGNVDLHPLGYGTQRVEAALQAALPQARVLRIDRDTTRAKSAWPSMREAIERGDVDVLVGTQLLAKGHDFPGLGLVCVLNADQSLYSTDFRASEHLFAQLTQVAGRAGRADIRGEVLIQTQFPAHPLYDAVRSHDYPGYARALLQERERAGFPPFVHQAVLRAEAARLDQALAFLAEAAQLAADVADDVVVFEPAPAAMERLKGQERAQLLVQSGTRRHLHAFLDHWADRLVEARAYGARWGIDVDPMSI